MNVTSGFFTNVARVAAALCTVLAFHAAQAQSPAPTVVRLADQPDPQAFLAQHADLLDAAFWQTHKERIAAGHVHDVFPYEPGKRFAMQRAANAVPALKPLHNADMHPATRPTPTPTAHQESHHG